MNNFYVYGLIDPRSDSIFYIGKGKNKRIYQHIKEKPNLFSNLDKLNRIKEIQSDGFAVEYKYIASELTEEIALFIERLLIYRLGRKIFNEGNLTNIVPGGEWKKGDSYFLRPSQIPTNDFINDFLPQYSSLLGAYPLISSKFTGLQCPNNPEDENLYCFDSSGDLIDIYDIDNFIEIFGLHHATELIDFINGSDLPFFAWNRIWSISQHESFEDISKIPFQDFDIIDQDFVNEINYYIDRKESLNTECYYANGSLLAEVEITSPTKSVKLISYYQNGNKKHETTNNGGILSKSQAWYSNGNLQKDIKYLNCNPFYEIHYFPSGKIESKREYDENGEWKYVKHWYENGQLSFENYSDGKSASYSEGGELIKKTASIKKYNAFRS